MQYGLVHVGAPEGLPECLRAPLLRRLIDFRREYPQEWQVLNREVWALAGPSFGLLQTKGFLRAEVRWTTVKQGWKTVQYLVALRWGDLAEGIWEHACSREYLRCLRAAGIRICCFTLAPPQLIKRWYRCLQWGRRLVRYRWTWLSSGLIRWRARRTQAQILAARAVRDHLLWSRWVAGLAVESSALRQLLGIPTRCTAVRGILLGTLGSLPRTAWTRARPEESKTVKNTGGSQPWQHFLTTLPRERSPDRLSYQTLYMLDLDLTERTTLRKRMDPQGLGPVQDQRDRAKRALVYLRVLKRYPAFTP